MEYRHLRTPPRPHPAGTPTADAGSTSTPTPPTRSPKRRPGRSWPWSPSTARWKQARSERAEEARVEAVWLGDRVPDDLAADVGQRYRSVLVYRDRAAMLTDLPLGTLPVFRAPRISERGRGVIRVALMVFLAVVAVIGVVPTTIAVANAPRAALGLAALAGSAAVTLTGLAVRSSMVTFVGITAVAWMVTAESTTTVGGILYRCLVLLVATWVGIVWLRAAQPGRVIREPRLDAALRRWRGQLPGSR